MTLQEAGRRFSFPMEMLQWYAENGLLKGNKMEDGTIDYSETELQRLSSSTSWRRRGWIRMHSSSL